MTNGFRLTTLSDQRWLEFVQAHPLATSFHDPAWSGVLAESYGCPVHALLFLDRAGSIEAGLPVVAARHTRRTSWVCLPFTDFCSPLLSEEMDPGDFVGRLGRARVEAGVQSVEIRSDLAGPDVQRGASSFVHDVVIPADLSKLRRTFTSNLRRNLARARQSGLDVRQASTEADLTRVFYGLHLQTRHRLGVPVQPRHYFQVLWRRMLDQGRGFLLIAEHEGVPVGAAVFLAFNHTLIYKYSASDSRYWHLRPNYAVIWEGMRLASQKEYTTFSFGRTGLQDDGLRRFKRQWGGSERTVTYSLLADGERAPSRVEMPGFARAALRRSPQFVVRLAGEALYKHMV